MGVVKRMVKRRRETAPSQPHRFLNGVTPGIDNSSRSVGAAGGAALSASGRQLAMRLMLPVAARWRRRMVARVARTRSTSEPAASR